MYTMNSDYHSSTAETRCRQCHVRRLRTRPRSLSGEEDPECTCSDHGTDETGNRAVPNGSGSSELALIVMPPTQDATSRHSIADANEHRAATDDKGQNRTRYPYDRHCALAAEEAGLPTGVRALVLVVPAQWDPLHRSPPGRIRGFRLYRRPAPFLSASPAGWATSSRPTYCA